MDYAEIEMPTENINFLGGRGLFFFFVLFFLLFTQFGALAVAMVTPTYQVNVY